MRSGSEERMAIGGIFRYQNGSQAIAMGTVTMNQWYVERRKTITWGRKEREGNAWVLFAWEWATWIKASGMGATVAAEGTFSWIIMTYFSLGCDRAMHVRILT
ncbi:hypothetical protein V6N13_069338 [Hibiscus sabdariffa]|uniref:Dirigent protein n=1 Tax=Hibiscus sabdariffa TaxID=183260 RepID=A0ABR2PGE3_9ROSI